MKPEDQIKALAELDGLSECVGMDDAGPVQWRDELAHVVELPDYLTSCDAIIPLIKKRWQSHKTDAGTQWQLRFWKTLGDHECLLFNPPNQLCEALLRATGKWTE